MKIINSNGRELFNILMFFGFMFAALMGCTGKASLLGRWDAEINGEKTYLDIKGNELVEEGVQDIGSEQFKINTYKYKIQRNTLILLSTESPVKEVKRIMYRLNGDELTIFQRRKEAKYKRRH